MDHPCTGGGQRGVSKDSGRHRGGLKTRGPTCTCQTGHPGHRGTLAADWTFLILTGQFGENKTIRILQCTAHRGCYVPVPAPGAPPRAVLSSVRDWRHNVGHSGMTRRASCRRRLAALVSIHPDTSPRHGLGVAWTRVDDHPPEPPGEQPRGSIPARWRAGRAGSRPSMCRCSRPTSSQSADLSGVTPLLAPRPGSTRPRQPWGCSRRSTSGGIPDSEQPIAMLPDELERPILPTLLRKITMSLRQESSVKMYR